MAILLQGDTSLIREPTPTVDIVLRRMVNDALIQQAQAADGEVLSSACLCVIIMPVHDNSSEGEKVCSQCIMFMAIDSGRKVF